MFKAPSVGGELSEEEFRLLMLEQLQELERAFLTVLPRVHTSVPAKPYDGLIAIADGTGWNPGSGAGYYGYYNGSWTFLG